MLALVVFVRVESYVLPNTCACVAHLRKLVATNAHMRVISSRCLPVPTFSRTIGFDVGPNPYSKCVVEAMHESELFLPLFMLIVNGAESCPSRVNLFFDVQQQ